MGSESAESDSAGSVLRGVRVFRDGSFGDPEDVAIDGGVIAAVGTVGTTDAGASPASGGTSPDGEPGGWLIPGLIDCHVHVEGLETLRTLAEQGITTVLDMGNPAAVLAPLRGTAGVADLRAAGPVATHPASAHAQRMRHGPLDLVGSPADAEPWVRQRVDEGADYLKVVIDLPGFDQGTVDALVAAAHAHGLRVVAHASRSDAVAMGQRAGVDVLTHAPLDRPIDAAQAAELAAAGTLLVPTLVMMRGIVDRLRTAGVPGPAYEPAADSVAAARAAGLPVLAGTDANATPAAPASPPFGESLHRELELLVDAGLSPAEALESATSVAADGFGLADRGRIAPGLRADLVLLDADPLADISATRRVRSVWVAGERVGGGSGSSEVD